MEFTELLKNLGLDDTKANELVEEMKKNKMYLSGEDNIDIRYSKLKGDFENLTAKEKEAQALIEELKKNSGDQEATKAKIKEYEDTIADLTKKNEELTIDNALKFSLLKKGAKADDIDYLIYRAKNSDKELKLDKEGNIKGLDDLVDDLKKSYGGNFEDKSKRKVDVKDLPDDKGEETPKVTQEMFKKMGYQERNKLYQEDKELYDKLQKGNE